MFYKVLIPILVLVLSSAQVQAYADLTNFKTLAKPFTINNASFFDENNNVIDLNQFKGKVTIINFWATWCPPCVKELPAIKKLGALLPSDKFNVVPISIDANGKSTVYPFIRSLGLEGFKSYFDPKQALGTQFPLEYIPASFILNTDGKLVAYARSYVNWEEPNVVNYVKSLAPSQ